MDHIFAFVLVAGMIAVIALSYLIAISTHEPDTTASFIPFDQFTLNRCTVYYFGSRSSIVRDMQVPMGSLRRTVRSHSLKQSHS